MQFTEVSSSSVALASTLPVASKDLQRTESSRARSLQPSSCPDHGYAPALGPLLLETCSPTSYLNKSHYFESCLYFTRCLCEQLSPFQSLDKTFDVRQNRLAARESGRFGLIRKQMPKTTYF